MICGRESSKVGHVRIGIFLGVIMHIDNDFSINGTCKGNAIGDRDNLDDVARSKNHCNALTKQGPLPATWFSASDNVPPVASDLFFERQR